MPSHESHIPDDPSFSAKQCMCPRTATRHGVSKLASAGELSDQLLRKACISSVAETGPAQLIFSAKEYLITPKTIETSGDTRESLGGEADITENDIAQECAKPAREASGPQNGGRDGIASKNTFMEVASCMGYDALLEFDICMKLLSHLKVIFAICLEAEPRCTRRRSLVVKGVVDIQVRRFFGCKEAG